VKKLVGLYGKVYNEQNVMLSGTHTHSGPGGYLVDLLFDLNTLGFVEQTFNAHLDGIVRVSILNFKPYLI
jgi:neutral ceramidase